MSALRYPAQEPRYIPLMDSGSDLPPLWPPPPAQTPRNGVIVGGPEGGMRSLDIDWPREVGRSGDEARVTVHLANGGVGRAAQIVSNTPSGARNFAGFGDPILYNTASSAAYQNLSDTAPLTARYFLQDAGTQGGRMGSAGPGDLPDVPFAEVSTLPAPRQPLFTPGVVRSVGPLQGFVPLSQAVGLSQPPRMLGAPVVHERPVEGSRRVFWRAGAPGPLPMGPQQVQYVHRPVMLHGYADQHHMNQPVSVVRRVEYLGGQDTSAMRFGAVRGEGRKWAPKLKGPETKVQGELKGGKGGAAEKKGNTNKKPGSSGDGGAQGAGAKDAKGKDKVKEGGQGGSERHDGKEGKKGEIGESHKPQERNKGAGGDGNGTKGGESQTSAGKSSAANGAAATAVPKVSAAVPRAIAGYIFGCTKRTRGECYNRRLFGVPKGHWSEVVQISDGTPLFLFNFDSKQLEGGFVAHGAAGWELEADAWSTSSNLKFPAQVRFEVKEEFPALKESEFRPAIQENYFTDRKFSLKLKQAQVDKLLDLFKKKASATKTLSGGTGGQSGGVTGEKKRGREDDGGHNKANVGTHPKKPDLGKGR